MGRWTHPQGLSRRSDGRLRILCRGGSEVLFARAVMEGKLGRSLLPTEIAHHINGDHEDDRPENVTLKPSQSDHARDHGHSWRTSRWPDRTCAGCGCDHDEATDGCRQCRDRHRQRAKAAA